VLRKWLPLSLVLLVCLAVPASASAVDLEIVNQSDRPAGDVYVTVVGEDPVEVTGMEPNVSKSLQQLEEEGHNPLDIQRLVAGRVYVSYGAGVDQYALPFASTTTRFDWVELNVHPQPADQINLTAVEQVGIGMRIETFGPKPKSERLGTIGSANSDTIFDALQQIPGGPQATIRNSGGEVLRVLSPQKLPAVKPGLSYPPLTPYMQSLAGQTITLRTTYGSTASRYSGTFAPDGSIVLRGTTDPPKEAEPEIVVPAAELATDIYTGENTADKLEGNIRRDLLVGFVTGLWGGKYGNDAGAFCTDAQTNTLGPFCPTWWTQPVFGDARAGLEPFPTCDQYAAVLSQYSETFANPYTERYAKPEIPIVEDDGTPVESAKLTILPDSGDAQPVAGGNANCGAAPPESAASPGAVAAAAPSAPRVKVLRLYKKGWVKGPRARVGRVVCTARCGRVRLIARKGRKVVGRGRYALKGAKGLLTMRLTRPGRRLTARRRRLKVRVAAWVTPPGGATAHRARAMPLAKALAHRRHRRRR
jgi:Beta-1,3-glucanase